MFEMNLCFMILPKPNWKSKKFCLPNRATRNRANKQVLRHKKVLTDLNVSCVGPSAFNGQDEYAERELESMGNDLHNNSHYDHNKSPSPFWIIMLPYCCLLHLFFPLYHSDPKLKIPFKNYWAKPITHSQWKYYVMNFLIGVSYRKKSKVCKCSML